MQGIFTLLLFALFAGAALLVLLLGVRSYRVQTEYADKAYHQRTCVQYVAAKVRGSDAADAIFIADFSESEPLSTLFIAEKIEGTLYYTRIYYYNGYVCELFSEAASTLSPAAGSNILPSQGLVFQETAGLLEIHVTDIHGRQTTLTLALRSAGGAE